MKRLQGTNITCYSFRHYYALRCHLKLIDSGSASLSMGHSIEAHHRNYPYSKESTTTNAFKQARERLTASIFVLKIILLITPLTQTRQKIKNILKNYK